LEIIGVSGAPFSGLEVVRGHGGEVRKASDSFKNRPLRFGEGKKIY